MGRSAIKLLPRTQTLLTDFGERIKLARRRRKITCKQMVDRLGISLNTYRKIESGDASVAMGHYLGALQSLQLQGDLALVAHEDKTGRLIQDSKLLTTSRTRTKASGSRTIRQSSDQPSGNRQPSSSERPLTPRAVTSKKLLSLIKTGKS